MNKLETDSILFEIDGRKILSDVYMCCDKGQVVGILGRNGSGKSSLLKIIFGRLRAQSQSVRFDKKYVAVPYAKKGLVQYLPQHYLLPDRLKIKTGIKLLVANDKIGTIKSINLIEKNLHKRAGEVSGGERRFIEALLVLFSPCEFTLFDEPFSYLSSVLIEELIPLIQAEAKTKGIIVTDHMYRHILDISDQTYLLINGVMKTVEDREDLVEYGYITSTD